MISFTCSGLYNSGFDCYILSINLVFVLIANVGEYYETSLIVIGSINPSTFILIQVYIYKQVFLPAWPINTNNSYNYYNSL
ncbi:hypothetical protein pb186bvf_005367 [Paramecium bursaria]